MGLALWIAVSCIGVYLLVRSPALVNRYERREIDLFGYRWTSDGVADSRRTAWRRRVLYGLCWIIGSVWLVLGLRASLDAG